MSVSRMRSSEAIHVLIIDDHPAVRQGLALLLEPEGIMVCGEASGCAEALEHLDEFQPDVVLVDLSLGDEDGMSLLGCLCDRHVPCMVYSMYEDGWHVERAFAAGALGYVTKREVHKVLVEAIGEVAAGRRFVSPKAAIALADQVADKQASISGLSSQEQQVYRLLGEGESTRAIATTMKVSPRTVESYYARILIKLGLEGMRELRRNAISHHHDQTH